MSCNIKNLSSIQKDRCCKERNLVLKSAFNINLSNTYPIRPNYHTVCLGFSNILGKTYGKTYIYLYYRYFKKKRLAKDLSNDAYAMFLCFYYPHPPPCFQAGTSVSFGRISSFFLIFFIKAYVVGLIWIASTNQCNSNGYPQHLPL